MKPKCGLDWCHNKATQLLGERPRTCAGTVSDACILGAGLHTLAQLEEFTGPGVSPLHVLTARSQTPFLEDQS